MAMYDDDEERIDPTRLADALARVQGLPRRLPPYQAEAQLFGIVGEVLSVAEVEAGDVPIEVRVTDEHLLPWTRPYRRWLSKEGQRYRVPENPVVYAMLTAFAELGLGFEVKRPLGPVLERLRHEYWEEWAAGVDDEGIDIDGQDAQGDVHQVRRLLRLGLHSFSNANLFDATAFLGRELFPSYYLADLAPADAIDELMRWALANQPLNGGERAALKGLLATVWNDELQPVPPTRALVALVKDLFLLPEDATAVEEERLVLLRRGALRLLGRLHAQVQSWGDEIVELPTEWFRQAKDPADLKSILGVSTATYNRLLLQPLVEAGILTLVEAGNHLQHTCARYRLAVDAEGDPLSWQEAEAALGS